MCRNFKRFLPHKNRSFRGQNRQGNAYILPFTLPENAVFVFCTYKNRGAFVHLQIAPLLVFAYLIFTYFPQ